VEEQRIVRRRRREKKMAIMKKKEKKERLVLHVSGLKGVHNNNNNNNNNNNKMYSFICFTRIFMKWKCVPKRELSGVFQRKVEKCTTTIFLKGVRPPQATNKQLENR
jgi:hypothetical protein